MLKTLFATGLLASAVSGPSFALVSNVNDENLQFNDDLENEMVATHTYDNKYTYYYRMHDFEFESHWLRYSTNTGYSENDVLFDFVLTTYVKASYRYSPWESDSFNGMYIHRYDFSIEVRKYSNSLSNQYAVIYTADVDYRDWTSYFENRNNSSNSYFKGLMPYLTNIYEFNDDYSVEYKLQVDSPIQHIIHSGYYSDNYSPYVYDLNNTISNGSYHFQIGNGLWSDWVAWRNSITVISNFATGPGSPIYDEGYSKGRDIGYYNGYTEASAYYNANGRSGVFSLLQSAFNPVSEFLSTEIAPGFSMGLLLSLPLAVGILIVVFKLVAK